jgi:hypothetical protein
MRITFQVVVSVLMVIAVLWWMWRLPRRDGAWFGWGPPLALLSAWSGLIGLILSALLWVLPYPDRWVVLLFLVLDPAAIGAGTLVRWIYRGYETFDETEARTVDMQRVQASVGIALGMAAVAVGYFYVMTHKAPLTPVGV